MFLRWALVLAMAGFLSGCASSTVLTRRAEKSDTYSSLSEDFKALVDLGEIKVGMPTDAVYIAWGRPNEVLRGESSAGATTTWVYYGAKLEEIRYWARRPTRYGYYPTEPYLERDYTLRDYVRAEVVFVDGRVKEWRTLPQPLR